MIRFVTICAAALFAVAACGETQPAGEGERLGNPAVYERITSLTDCAEIQGEFDTAFDMSERAEPNTDEHRTAVAYMEAAQARFDEVGC